MLNFSDECLNILMLGDTGVDKSTFVNSIYNYLTYETVKPWLELPQSNKCLNILILGETGVDKSTFVNSIYNYLTYETLDDAMNGGLKVLIPTTFLLTDHDNYSRTIRARPNVLEENHTENENLEVGQSATTNPRAYLFTEGNRRIRIIDTPGIDDIRGISQDDKKITKILTFVSQYRELHAICILLKPNEARLTPIYRYCIDELLIQLQLSTAKNILFCFTNTRACFSETGNTLATLSTHVVRYQENEAKLALDATTKFCFDNESLRFLCACAAGFNEIAGDINVCRQSWEKSVEETKKLFSLIQWMPAHQVDDALFLHIAKKVLLELTAPMIDIARVHIINRNRIEKKKKEIKQLDLEAEDFRNQLCYNQIETTFEQLEKPQMICTSARCATLLAVAVYGSMCVEDSLPCAVMMHKCDNLELKKLLHSVDYINCRKCGCHWNKHMLSKYARKEKLVTIKNEKIREAIEQENIEQDELKDFVKQLDEELAEMKNEQKILMQSCALLAYTVRENALLPYDISHEEYIDFLIRRERQTSGSSTIEGLKTLKKQYGTEMNLLTTTTSVTTTTAKKCVEMLQKLRTLKHCRPISEKFDELISNIEI